MKTFIAIDPGSEGGIAWRHGTGRAAAVNIPKTYGETVILLREIIEASELMADSCEAHIELVGGYIGKAQPGSAMFVFGKGAGILEGALMMAGVRVLTPLPQEWQKTFAFGRKTKRTTKKGKVVNDETAWKNKLKAEAQRRFPHIKVTKATADALLILEHAQK